MRHLLNYIIIIAIAVFLPSPPIQAQESAFASAQKEIPLNIHSFGTIVRILPPEDGLSAVIDISNDSIHTVNWHKLHISETKSQLFSNTSTDNQVLIALAEAAYNAGCAFVVSYNSTTTSDKFDIVFTYPDLQRGLKALNLRITDSNSSLAKILDGGRVGIPIPLYIPTQGSLVSIESPTSPLTIVVDITNTTDAQKFHWMKENRSYIKGRYFYQYYTLGNTMVSLLRAAYYIGSPLALNFISASTPERFTITFSIDEMAKILTTINK